MAARVYSTRFIATAGGDAGLTWSCPGGFRAVVRQITVITTGVAGDWAQVIVAGWNVLLVEYPAQPRNHYYDVRFTVYAGENVTSLGSSAGVHTVINGYLFEEPPAGGDAPSEPQGPGDAAFSPGRGDDQAVAAAALVSAIE